MAISTSLASSVPISGGCGSYSYPSQSQRTRGLSFSNHTSFGKIVKNAVPMTMKSNQLAAKSHKFAVRADYSNSDRGGDFVAGFLLGGAIGGTLGYIFAPQIRKLLLNEDEHGFRKAKRPLYYEEDDALEKTRQTLNSKLKQLNAAIDKVYSRLKGGNNLPPVPVESESEVEAV